MRQACDGKVTGVAVFLKAAGTNATIQQLLQGLPTPRAKSRRSSESS
jgi:hypothetical protein